MTASEAPDADVRVAIDAVVTNSLRHADDFIRFAAENADELASNDNLFLFAVRVDDWASAEQLTVSKMSSIVAALANRCAIAEAALEKKP